MDDGESDILREVGDRAFAAGRIYQRQGRAVAFAWKGNRIVAQLQGSGRGPYRQAVSIHGGGKGR